MGNDSKLDSVTALPSDRAGGPTDLSRDASQPEALIPSAGDWGVFCSPSHSSYMFHEVGVIDSVKPKTIWAKIGYGRRLRRFDRDNVIPARDEDDAKLIRSKLDSAKAESSRRVSEAHSFYKQKLGAIAAQAIEARRAATGTGAVHESAVVGDHAPISSQEQSS